MATSYPICGAVTIRPRWWRDPPWAQVGINDRVLFDRAIESELKVNFQDDLPRGNHRLWIRFLNKTDQDTRGDLDKAVIIEAIDFYGITSKSFVWQGVYEPIYPQGWRDQIQQQGQILEPRLRYHNYLGWNGVWYLEFTSPIFTWIHQTENMGWIYD